MPSESFDNYLDNFIWTADKEDLVSFAAELERRENELIVKSEFVIYTLKPLMFSNEAIHSWIASPPANNNQ